MAIQSSAGVSTTTTRQDVEQPCAQVVRVDCAQAHSTTCRLSFPGLVCLICLSCSKKGNDVYIDFHQLFYLTTDACGTLLVLSRKTHSATTCIFKTVLLFATVVVSDAQQLIAGEAVTAGCLFVFSFGIRYGCSQTQLLLLLLLVLLL